MGSRIRKWVLSTCVVLPLSACGGGSTSPTTVPASPDIGGTLPEVGTPSAIHACVTTIPDPAAISVGDEITLNASCSDPSSEIVRFDWDLGDGRARNGMVVHPRYNKVGAYSVRLTVLDTEGRTSTIRFDVRVEIIPPQSTVPALLQACMTWSRVPGYDPDLAPCGIRFDATCSTGDIAEYQWFFQGDPNWPDFGDATVTTSEPQVGYTWREDIECFVFRPFERVVRLTVVGSNGQRSTIEAMVQLTHSLR